MLDFRLLRDRGILIVSPRDALTAGDFKSVAQEVDPYLDAEGKLTGLLIDAPSFPGWSDFAALIEHLKFVRDHQRRIDRVAVVSDSPLLHLAPNIAQHFAHPEFKAFAAHLKEAALAWLGAKN